MKNMSYYQRVEQAQGKIKVLISTGVCTLDDIKRHIFEEMQMGERFVNKYVEGRIVGGYAETDIAGIIKEPEKYKKKVVEE